MADEADDLRTSLLGECIGEDNIISRMGEDALTRGGRGIGEDAVNVNELIVYLDCIVRRSLHSEYCDANQRFLMVLVSISGSSSSAAMLHLTFNRRSFGMSLYSRYVLGGKLIVKPARTFQRSYLLMHIR